MSRFNGRRVAGRWCAGLTKDSSILSRPIICPQELGLQRRLADETDEDADQTGEEERSAPDFLDEEGAEDVTGEGGRDPEGGEEERHVAAHAEGDVEDDAVVGDLVGVSRDETRCGEGWG